MEDSEPDPRLMESTVVLSALLGKSSVLGDMTGKFAHVISSGLACSTLDMDGEARDAQRWASRWICLASSSGIRVR